jgi:tetratricopeptide (TPR) repeat protein
MADAGKPEALPSDRRFRRGLWIRPVASANAGRESRGRATPDGRFPTPAGARRSAGITDEQQTAFDLAETWLRKGRLAKAIPYLEHVERGPLSSAAAGYLGAICAELGRFERAEHWFRRALSGQDSFAQRGYGILLDITTYLGAGDKYTRWAADGGDGAAANHVGGSLILRDFGGDGEAVLRRAATEYGHAPAMFRLALVLAARGDRAEAVMWCDRARGAGDQAANCCLTVFRVHAGELTAEDAAAVKRPRATDGYESLVRALERKWGARAPRNADRYLRLAARENLDGILALRMLGPG